MFTSTITIEGRLADDPAALENLSTFVVLTNRRKPDGAGEWANTDTSRYTVKCFKTLTTKVGDQLYKGDQVLLADAIATSL